MYGKLLIHTAVLGSGGIVALWLTGLVASRQHKPGGRWMMLAMLAVSVYCFAAAVEAQVLGEAAKVLWSQIEYIGYTQCAFCFFGFTICYLGFGVSVPRAVWYVLGAVPWITLVLVWTNASHHLVWTGFSPGDSGQNVLVYHHGPVFYAFFAYTQVLGSICLGLVWWVRRHAQGLYRSQLGLMLAGIAAPMLSGVCYVFDWVPVGGMDVGPVGLLASAIFLAWSFERYQLLDLVPSAREAMLEMVPDGMLVFDEHLRLVDLNAAAAAVLGQRPAEVIGRTAQAVLGRWPSLPDLLRGEQAAQVELVDSGSECRAFDVRVLPLRQGVGSQRGRLVVLRDNTQARRAAQERERLIAELQEALAQVQTLSGLLPICAHCKKIRDDAGYWNQIETYLSRHSQVKFTHGLCPDCTKIYFPGIEPQG